MEYKEGSKALVWLREEHDRILDVEKSGLKLMQAGDISGYRDKMKEKAEALANLAHHAGSVLEYLPPKAREYAEKELSGFSASAQTSLKLNSPFYMSALLYPLEHKCGEPDNMENLIEELKVMIKE